MRTCMMLAIIVAWIPPGCRPATGFTPCASNDDCPPGFRCDGVRQYCWRAADAGPVDGSARDALLDACAERSPLEGPLVDIGTDRGATDDRQPARDQAVTADLATSDIGSGPGDAAPFEASREDATVVDTGSGPSDGTAPDTSTGGLDSAVAADQVGAELAVSTDIHVWRLDGAELIEASPLDEIGVVLWVPCATTCVCGAGQTCTFDCSNSGCEQAECLGASCSADCPDGNCALDCDLEAGDCRYGCAGGGCVFDCDHGSSCTHTCSGGGCQLGCDNGSTCSLNCEGAPSACSVSCTAGATATCTGNCTNPGC